MKEIFADVIRVDDLFHWRNVSDSESIGLVSKCQDSNGLKFFNGLYYLNDEICGRNLTQANTC